MLIRGDRVKHGLRFVRSEGATRFTTDDWFAAVAFTGCTGLANHFIGMKDTRHETFVASFSVRSDCFHGISAGSL